MFNSFTDTCECKPYYDKSILSKYPRIIFLKEQSWIWKWMAGTTNIERFFGSSKWFVSVTDFWHFCELGEILSLLISASLFSLYLDPYIGLYSVIVSTISVYVISSSVFDYMFHVGLRNRNIFAEYMFIVPFLWLHNLIFKSNE